MNAVIPFSFDGASIRVLQAENGEPLFVGKDICAALGYADSATAMRSHCRGVQKLHPIPDALGRIQEARVLSEPDVLRLIVNCSLPAAVKFERWVFEEVLPSIRKTGAYASTGTPTLVPAAKEFKAVFGVLRLIGCDKQAAAIGANQAIASLRGTNFLQLTSQTHLEAANQESRWYTPTELGKRIEVSGRQFNLLLAEAGLQMKDGDDWKATPAAESFFRLFDTGKRHGNGTPVTQLKWADNVLKLVRPARETA